MSSYLSNLSDRVSVYKGIANPDVLFLDDIANLSAELFIKSLPITQLPHTLSKKDVEEMDAQQKDVMRMIFSIPSSSDFPDRDYTLPSHLSSLLVDKYKAFYQNQLRNASPPTLSIPPKDCGNAELLRQLSYYSFLAAISQETKQNIVRYLPYDKKLFPNSSDVVAFYNYDETLIPRGDMEPSIYLFLDHITFTLFIVIRDMNNIYDTMHCILPKIQNGSIESFVNVVGCKVMSMITKKAREWLESYPSYVIKIVGHGYGAAIAAGMMFHINYKPTHPKDDPEKDKEKKREIYSIKWWVDWEKWYRPRFKKEEKEYTETYIIKASPFKRETTKAILFGCPPVISEIDTCRSDISGSIVSVVFGWDMIPTLSLKNIPQKRLKGELFPFNTDLYVPGTVYWLKRTPGKKIDGIEIILKSHSRLELFSLHPEIDFDHDIRSTYLYLLAATAKKEREI